MTIINSNAICGVGARVSRSIRFTNRYWRIYVYVLLRVFLGQLDRNGNARANLRPPASRQLFLGKL